MNISSKSCEGCHEAPIERAIDTDQPEQPYRLCQACAHRLLTYALRPLEWFRLAALHGPDQYYLHDDFYWDNGIAQVSKEEVLAPERFPAPSLQQAKEDVNTLIDYALTRHNLVAEQTVFDALRRQNGSVLLTALQDRVAHTHTIEIASQVYIICANVLGRKAEDWIRSRWDVPHADVFVALAVASAACLPFEEGFDRVVQELEQLPEKQRRLSCFALAYFHTEKTLDWLETHVTVPITDVWGKLAAMSHFSWKRAVRWLDQGRPLSLVALDALKACERYDTPLLRRDAPKLLEPDTRARMSAKLESYAAHDPAPRVKQSVATILSQWKV